MERGICINDNVLDEMKGVAMFPFENLEVYKKSRILTKEVIVLLSEKKGIDYTLKDQLKRAMISVTLNVAEGAGRFHKADKKNFYINSRASINECVAVFQLLLDLDYVTRVEYEQFYARFEELSRMLSGLINSQK